MHALDDFFIAVWIVFWVGWLAAATTSKAGARSRLGQSVGIRVVIIVIVVALERAGVFKGHAATVSNPVLQGVGTALFLAGLALAVWARVYLGRNWGSPMSEKEEPELVTSGPYRWIRHPIYSGLILAGMGTAVAVAWLWFVVVVLVGGFFVYSAFVEERIMRRRFPETYPRYVQSTKRLIPFVF